MIRLVNTIILIFYIILWIILLPLQIIIQSIYRNLWFPSIKKYEFNKNLNKKIDKSQFNNNLNGYYDGDAAKFIGMNYWANPNELNWKLIKEFWDFEHFTFFRIDKPELSFSGDMFSGLFLAIIKRYYEQKLTQYEIQFLKKCIWNLIFSNKIPFKFGNNDFSRGYIWAPWQPNLGSFYNLLNILKFYYLIETNKIKKYSIYALFWFFQISGFPLTLIGSFDSNIFIKNYYCCWWYNSHSYSLIYLTSYLLNIFYATKQIKYLALRYYFNADILAIYYYCCPHYNFLKDNILILLNENLELNKDFEKFDKKEFLSIRDIFKTNKDKKIFYDTWLGGKHNADYIWERSPLQNSNFIKGDLHIIFPLSFIN